MSRKVIALLTVGVLLVLALPVLSCEPPQWCSPGYWRNHPDAWAATGISPNTLYGETAVSKLGQKAGAPTNPTLWQVLQSPQYYGGDAFNAVADLLSDAHPDVNFDGTRYEDSCPLN